MCLFPLTAVFVSCRLYMWAKCPPGLSCKNTHPRIQTYAKILYLFHFPCTPSFLFPLCMVHGKNHRGIQGQTGRETDIIHCQWKRLELNHFLLIMALDAGHLTSFNDFVFLVPVKIKDFVSLLNIQWPQKGVKFCLLWKDGILHFQKWWREALQTSAHAALVVDCWKKSNQKTPWSVPHLLCLTHTDTCIHIVYFCCYHLQTTGCCSALVVVWNIAIGVIMM